MLDADNTFDDDHRKALVEENTSMSGLRVTYEPVSYNHQRNNYYDLMDDTDDILFDTFKAFHVLEHLSMRHATSSGFQVQSTNGRRHVSAIPHRSVAQLARIFTHRGIDA